MERVKELQGAGVSGGGGREGHSQRGLEAELSRIKANLVGWGVWDGTSCFPNAVIHLPKGATHRGNKVLFELSLFEGLRFS